MLILRLADKYGSGNYADSEPENVIADRNLCPVNKDVKAGDRKENGKKEFKKICDHVHPFPSLKNCSLSLICLDV